MAVLEPCIVTGGVDFARRVARHVVERAHRGEIERHADHLMAERAALAVTVIVGVAESDGFFRRGFAAGDEAYGTVDAFAQRRIDDFRHSLQPVHILREGFDRRISVQIFIRQQLRAGIGGGADEATREKAHRHAAYFRFGRPGAVFAAGAVFVRRPGVAEPVRRCGGDGQIGQPAPLGGVKLWHGVGDDGGW